MKKFFLTFLFATAAFCVCSFALTACGGNTPEPEPAPEIGPTPTAVITLKGTDYIGVLDWEYESGKYETEFRLGDGEWLTPGATEMLDGYNCSPVWRDLTPGSTYTLYARFKTQENGAVVSGESYSERITLDKRVAHDRPDVTVRMTDGKTAKVTGFTDKMQASYSLITPDGKASGSDGYIEEDTFTFDENGIVTVKVRFKETQTTVYDSYTVIDSRATDFGGGTGSREDPFLIKNYEQLTKMGSADFHYMPHDSYFRLESDIECPENHEPISEGAAYFNYLDGNGKKITGLNVSKTQNSIFYMYAGLFQGLAGVENLTVENAKITVKYDVDNSGAYMGIIAGSVHSYVRNCKVSGSLELFVYDEQKDFVETLDSTIIQAGGLAGSVIGGIENCTADVKIILPNAVVRKFAYFPYCGGLAGSCLGNVKTSSANVTIGGKDNLPAVSNGGMFGGLIGSGASGTAIENCYSSVIADVKFTVPNSRADILSSYAGGLAGKSVNAIKNSYAHCNYSVEAESVAYTLFAGGLTGASVTELENCFADATLNLEVSRLTADALAILLNNEASVTNCYFVSGETAAAEGATAVSLDTLRSDYWQRENLGWDEEVWQFHDYNTESGKFYPTLK